MTRVRGADRPAPRTRRVPLRGEDASDTIFLSLIYHKEKVMGRTPGAKNRTPRELRAEARRLNEKADYMEKLQKLKNAGGGKK